MVAKDLARVAMRTGAGPLVLAGFFLPWAHGPGVLAANEFTGYRLVAFAGRLQQLDLWFAGGGLLFLGARLLLVGIAVAAVWLTLLAPRHRWHPGYRAAGWYIAVFAVIAGALGLAKSGVEAPPPGLGLLILGGALFVFSQLIERRAAHA